MRLPARWLLLLPLLLLAVPLRAVQAPSIEWSGGGLLLARLPPVLNEAEVRKQLGTGLTTSFVFQLTARGPANAKIRGGARVDIRYELWDEVYLVTWADVHGRPGRRMFSSFERLAEWWRDARIMALPASSAMTAKPVEIRLRIIPFSQSEQLDAQRWFSQALSAEKSGSAGALNEAAEDRSESFGQVLNLLMATSIGRPALLEYEWKIPLPARPKK